MPDRRRHRGPHPEDHRLFALDQRPRLRAGAGDLCWLLDRGYAITSSLKLVGDRYALTARQRLALRRVVCTAGQAARRRQSQVSDDDVSQAVVWLDGYNLLTGIEAALSGGVLLVGRDRTLRDLASMHGSYRKVAETESAICLIGGHLQRLHAAGAVWLLDRPVSNSGRLKKLIEQIAEKHGWSWEVRVTYHPDAELAAASEVIVSADSGVLERCTRWLNLGRQIVEQRVPDAWVLDLFADKESPG